MSQTLDQKFANLPQYRKRRYLSNDVDLTDLEQVKACFQKLLDQSIDSIEDLKKWMEHSSELSTVFDQVGSVIYIKMTCQTDNEKYSSDYQKFISEIIPAIQPLSDQLNRKFLKAVEDLGFDEPRYQLYIKEVKTSVELYREENIELSTKVQMLSQEYQQITGAMTVEFDGEEKTMPEMGKILVETDRDLRERAWKTTSERRMKEKDKLEQIFDDMLKLRHQIALNAGFENFRDYKFKSLLRFDYTPDDCKTYHKSVEEVLVPLWKKILQKRKEDMNLDALRPWDTAVDPLGREALKPFEKSEELIKGCLFIFEKIDDELGRDFKDMADHGLLDLDSRKGKAPGGYQSSLAEAGKPFIFMNAVGLDGDVRTLLHEGGHAFHSVAAVDQEISAYRHAPMEFCEVASMSMELLGNDYLTEFYSEDDRKRSVTDHLEDIIFVLIWVATIDAFQHWMYENPEHSREDRRESWENIRRRFSGGLVDWSGFEDVHAYMWHKQLHIFEVPFYYIEYAIAQLGALQLWLNSKSDFKQAVEDYKKSLALGGSKPLPELFEAAGIKFDFSKETIEPLANAVWKELEGLYD